MARLPFYDDIIGELSRQPLMKEDLHRRKLELTRKHSLAKIPSDIDILLEASVDERKRMGLLSKPMRTQAGVSPIAIMAAPLACPHGKCTFCPDHLKEGIPMSYTGKEPASMRGKRWDWDAYLQTFNRLEQYVASGHAPNKCEVIVMGGTVPSYPLSYQEAFVHDLFQAMNDFGEAFFPGGDLDLDFFKEFFELPGDLEDMDREERVRARMLALKDSGSRSLEEEQSRNERAIIRCVGLTFETRPDCGLLPHGNLMLRFGVTRVELGVQSVYDECLEITHRAHDAAMNKRSIQVLRDLGFKLNFHLMPGLPGADKRRISYDRDLEGLRQIFIDDAYRPDMVKVYPCMVMPNTPLAEDYRAGIFEPLGTDEAVRMLEEFLPEVPEYCRIMRVQRDIPTYRTEAGVDKTNLRQMVHKNPERDIRAREIKGQVVDEADMQIIVREYSASGGTEFFISAEDMRQDLLLGFCRLRFPKELLRPEITASSALVRELHVYGHATRLAERGTVQHRGWGSKLLKEAERIASEHGKDRIVVISGVGVRAYYEDKHGYSHEGPYMVKRLH